MNLSKKNTLHKVSFITPTPLSLLDLTSMGGSVKRGSLNKIGQFDSGLKYAVALLLRNGVAISITVNNEIGYSFDSYIVNDGKRDKELISICENSALGSFTHKTGFAKALGYNWELWMAIRELYSNALDEGGFMIVSEENCSVSQGTLIELKFDSLNPLKEVMDNIGVYINLETPIHIVDESLQLLYNEEGYLRIYKNNILVYKDENIISKYAFNIGFGEIDERRILNDVADIERLIINKLSYFDDETFLREILTHDFVYDDNEFLRGTTDSWSKASDLVNYIANEVFAEHGVVNTYPWLLSKIQNRPDCSIQNRRISSLSDHIWSYSTDVVLKSPQTEKTSLKEQIEALYNFNIDVEIKIGDLKGSEVVADKFSNCLIVSSTFDIERDIPSLIVQYFDLTSKKNIIKSLSEYIVTLIKK